MPDYFIVAYCLCFKKFRANGSEFLLFIINITATIVDYTLHYKYNYN